MGVFWQIVSSLVICYHCLSVSVIMTWPSSTYKLFESTNTTLNRPMTSTELALFGSLSSIGAVISTPISSYLIDRLGRKHTVTMFSVVYVVYWALLAAFKQVEVVLFAIFVSGLGGGIFQVAPMFAVEMCEKSLGGAMATASMVFYAVGILVSYLFGGFLQYDVMIYVCLSMAVFGVLITCPLKESPIFLMQKGHEDEAMENIAFFRSAKLHSKEVLEEIDNIKRSLNPDMDDDVPEDEQSLKKEKVEVKVVKEKLSSLQFLRRSESSRRSLFITMVIMMTSIFQGVVVVQVYAEPLFSEAVPSISSFLCCVIFALIIIASGIVAAVLTEYAGRKVLMVYSSIATGIICVLLGTQIHLHWGPHALTAVLIYMFCVTYTLGAGTIPFVINAEVFLPEIKSFASMLVIEVAWICNFVVLFVFNPLVSLIGLGQLFYIFAVVCFLTAAFSAYYQPETRGLLVNDIQAKFVKKRGNRVI